MKMQSLFEVIISMFISMLIVFAILHYVLGGFTYPKSMDNTTHSANSSVAAVVEACGCLNSGS
jgi:hypothetical protein